MQAYGLIGQTEEGIWPRHFISELWPLISYAYRAKIILALLLFNYWLEFNKNLWELLNPRGDVHIVAMLKLFRPDPSLQSDGP
jgi:hypothetical protein